MGTPPHEFTLAYVYAAVTAMQKDPPETAHFSTKSRAVKWADAARSESC